MVELEGLSWRPTGPSCDNSSCRRHPSLSETSVNLGLGRAVLDDLVARVFKTLFLYFVYFYDCVAEITNRYHNLSGLVAEQ